MQNFNGYLKFWVVSFSNWAKIFLESVFIWLTCDFVTASTRPQNLRISGDWSTTVEWRRTVTRRSWRWKVNLISFYLPQGRLRSVRNCSTTMAIAAKRRWRLIHGLPSRWTDAATALGREDCFSLWGFWLLLVSLSCCFSGSVDLVVMWQIKTDWMLLNFDSVMAKFVSVTLEFFVVIKKSLEEGKLLHKVFWVAMK